MPASASAATTAGNAVRWPRLDSIAYGGDYTPEQWPEEIWAEDVRLMREAGVNLVTVGVFSWALLEPSEGIFDFGWLDRVIGLLHDGGIGVDLATPTAAPPAWFLRAYPQARPVTAEGHVLGGACRQSYCPSSPAYARASARIAEQLATRYGQHPALTLWHVHNEYGCHVPACYCDQSARAFRDWLRERYGSLGDLNAAWGTAFWGQRYGTWDEIDVPRSARGRCAATAWRTSPAARTASCSISGGPVAAARRNSTRRCCRTAAPPPGSGARSSSSAGTSRPWASCAPAGSRPAPPSCGTGSRTGRSNWRGTRPSSPTRSASPRSTGSCGAAASPATSSTRKAISAGTGWCWSPACT